MGFAVLSLKAKVIVIALALFLPAMGAGTIYFFSEVHRYAARTAADGLMNFADAKQQGVIRFIGQNEKLARTGLQLADDAGVEAVRSFATALVKNDVFKVEEHPFKEEILSNDRRIAALEVYRSIDYVENGQVIASSDPVREGRPWVAVDEASLSDEPKAVDLDAGYSQVYMEGGRPTLLFGAQEGERAFYIRANAAMLTNIVTGEIGNLEGDMGAFYLAGVGRTFDYYLVDANNRLITESRVVTQGILRARGSEFPWRATQQTAGIECQGKVYQTNVGALTGCREAMGFYEGSSGVRMLGASMPFYDSGWTLVVEQEADELLAPLYELLVKVSIIGLLIALLAVVLFILIVDRYVFRPLASAFRG